MAIDIKFTKFDNTPWGFRLAGGSDFPQPLTVIRVTEGSLAECMGLEVGDVVVRLNDQPMSNLTHGKAHEALVLAGNNFILGVLRGEESRKAVEAIQEKNIVPYTIPLEELPPVFPEEVRQETLVVETFHESETSVTLQSSEEVNDKEEVPDKPKDADSEDVPNQNLTDDEIAQLILEEEELLEDQGVLGVNFKKLRPRAPLLKDSKVFEELQNIATAEPPQVQELKRTTTFLQKPYRPVPLPKSQQEAHKVESYKVIIKKQQKKSITERLLEKGLLEAGSIKNPEPKVEKITPSVTPEPEEKLNEETTQVETKMEEKLDVIISEESTEMEEEQQEGPQIEEIVAEESVCDEKKPEEQRIKEVVPKVDKKKIKELVSTEISLEKQLENVQSQLLALKQLPSEIENHLKIVSEQLHKIMELSVQNGSNNSSRRGSEQERNTEEEIEEKNENREVREKEEQEEMVERERQNEIQEEEEHQQQQGQQVETEAKESPESESQDQTRSSKPRNGIPIIDGEAPQIIEPDEDQPQEKKELEIKVKSKDETGKKVKKFIVSYESKVLRSREPSPAPSNGSFEPDPSLAPKDQVIQELQHRRGRKHSQDLWPQAKQLELTYGRRWRCPNDFFNDEMIAEVLSCQAEVIRGRTLGINFKKYEKTNLPNYDHLMNSSVYRMVHKMEREPKKGIPVRPAKVNAAEDILERVKSPALSDADDRSNRSVSD